MHSEAFTFVVMSLVRIGTDGKHILDVGALDVNSSSQGMSIRALCAGASYVGIDEYAGPGVDIVASARDYDGAQAFDIVLSTEAMEHTPDPNEILQCAERALKPGGWLVLTAAGPGRAPHGCSGGGLPPDEYYQNIDPASLAVWLKGWAAVQIETDPRHGDVYACARKPPARGA